MLCGKQLLTMLSSTSYTKLLIVVHLISTFEIHMRSKREAFLLAHVRPVEHA